ncbi:hypothetical protein ACIOC2_19300 [Streptomyces sp. NPDC088337]|uniref:hypothetical protein n=1 Tax=unclassified Streptomyces TaxID=2593676 RepID=UPI00380E649C
MTDRPDPAGEQVAAATALLMAAITFRDLMSSMHPTVAAAMPPDLRNRVTSHRYQDAFNRLPEHIRAAAREAVLADPDIIAARQIHAEGQS